MEMTCHPRLGGAREAGEGHRNQRPLLIYFIKTLTYRLYPYSAGVRR